MPPQPSIVWITVESTRYDHTSMSGYDRDTTPRIAAFGDGADARSFDQAVSHGIWTRASGASMLTGTYPSHHGTGVAHDSVPTDLPTVAELLRDAGYATAAVSTVPHITAATGLDRGFDDFRWLTKSRVLDAVPTRALLSYLFRLRRYSAGYTTTAGVAHDTSYLVTETAKSRLDAATAGGDPAYLYVHYGDPHHPYVPPLSYLDRYTDDLAMDGRTARDLALEMSDRLHETIAEGCPYSEAEWAALEAMYDAAIAFTDEQVGELVDHVRSTLDDAVVVVTADHGELFGRSGLLGHKLLVHDDVSRVPLVVGGPTAVADHDGDTVQHVDVVRTLLAEVGADTDTLQGYDLRTEERQYGVVQRGGDRAAEHLALFEDLNPDFDASPYRRGLVTAFRGDGAKYVRDADGEALYDLPDEDADVSATRPDEAAAYREAVDEFLAGPGAPVASDRAAGAVSEEVRSQLEELGYLT